MKAYKPSMFNRILSDGDDLIIYNSFGGSKSLIRVRPETKDKIYEWLTSNIVLYQNDSDFLVLVQKGFLVSQETDEKSLRRLRYMEHITDNRLELVVHLTKACNFRCSYCYMNFASDTITPDVQNGIVNYVRKSLQKYRSVHISWFGGEPLLNVDAIEKMSHPILALCKAQNKPYSAIITTNGYCLTPDNVRRLIDCRVNHIAVTIDGTKELHNRQRVLKDGSPTFDRIIQNLEHIRDNIKSRTLTVSIRTNITTDHLPYLEQYYAFFDEKFGQDHRFSLFIRPVADYGGDRVKSMESHFVHNMAATYKRVMEIQKDIKFFPNFLDIEIGGYTCPARHLYKFTIGCDGSVSKCDEDLDSPIGKITADGSMHIDEYLHSNWLFPKPKEECDDCYFSGSCFMELCPKARIESNYTQCSTSFQDIDALILLAANTYVIPIL